MIEAVIVIEEADLIDGRHPDERAGQLAEIGLQALDAGLDGGEIMLELDTGQVPHHAVGDDLFVVGGVQDQLGGRHDAQRGILLHGGV